MAQSPSNTISPIFLPEITSRLCPSIPNQCYNTSSPLKAKSLLPFTLTSHPSSVDTIKLLSCSMQKIPIIMPMFMVSLRTSNPVIVGYTTSTYAAFTKNRSSSYMDHTNISTFCQSVSQTKEIPFTTTNQIFSSKKKIGMWLFRMSSKETSSKPTKTRLNTSTPKNTSPFFTTLVKLKSLLT